MGHGDVLAGGARVGQHTQDLEVGFGKELVGKVERFHAVDQLDLVHLMTQPASHVKCSQVAAFSFLFVFEHCL